MLHSTVNYKDEIAKEIKGLNATKAKEAFRLHLFC